MSEQLRIAGVRVPVANLSLNAIRGMLTARNVLLGAVPVAILVASPNRVALSVGIAAVYVAGALWLSRPTWADRVLLGYALLAAVYMGLSFVRADLIDGLDSAQLAYGSSKALYFIAVIVPFSVAVALLVSSTDALKPIIVVQLAMGVAVALLAVITRSGTVLGAERYGWEGNLAAFAAVLVCQLWVLRDTRLAALICALSVGGLMFAEARQSIILAVVALAISAVFWLAVRIKDSGWRVGWRSPLVLLPTGTLVLMGAGLLFTYLIFGPLSRDSVGAFKNPCHCATYRVVEVFTDPGGRSDLLKAGVKMFEHHPIAGAGLGAFVGQVKGYDYPHNIVLEVGAEMGVIGVLIIFVPLLLATVRLLRTTFLTQSKALASLLVLTLGYFVIASLSGDVPSARGFWILAFVVLRFAFNPATVPKQEAAASKA